MSFQRHFSVISASFQCYARVILASFQDNCRAPSRCQFQFQKPVPGPIPLSVSFIYLFIHFRKSNLKEKKNPNQIKETSSSSRAVPEQFQSSSRAVPVLLHLRHYPAFNSNEIKVEIKRFEFNLVKKRKEREREGGDGGARSGRSAQLGSDFRAV